MKERMRVARVDIEVAELIGEPVKCGLCQECRPDTVYCFLCFRMLQSFFTKQPIIGIRNMSGALFGTIRILGFSGR